MKKANLTFIFGPLHGEMVPQRAWESRDWHVPVFSNLDLANRGVTLPEGEEFLPIHIYERTWTPGGYAMQYKGLM